MFSKDLDVCKFASEILANLIQHIRVKRILRYIRIVEFILLNCKKNLALPSIRILSYRSFQQHLTMFPQIMVSPLQSPPLKLHLPRLLLQLQQLHKPHPQIMLLIPECIHRFLQPDQTHNRVKVQILQSPVHRHLLMMSIQCTRNRHLDVAWRLETRRHHLLVETHSLSNSL